VDNAKQHQTGAELSDLKDRRLSSQHLHWGDTKILLYTTVTVPLADADQGPGCRRATILRNPSFCTFPEVVEAMEQLDKMRFPKLMAYLRSPVDRRIRTNNHVWQNNRLFLFVIVKQVEVWNHWSPTTTAEFKPQGSERGRMRRRDAVRRTRPAA
jgi:hypothetical protein